MIALPQPAQSIIMLATLASLAIQLSGCGLFKRSDAINPVTTQFIHSVEPQTSLSRASGSATYTRLIHLFPSATATLPASDFAFEGATGINRAFGAQTRPADALAQMALRAKVANLCENNINDPDQRLFKLSAADQLLSGEAAPSDPATSAALAVARNAWLHPYQASDPEVQELVGLYNKALTLSTGVVNESGVTGAKRAICQAALLSPHFWMGTPETDDPAKRVSVELFRRVPPMQEMQDFIDGKFAIDAYFDRLLKDPVSQKGFLQTMHEWHEEWLGFREFFDTTTVFEDRRTDLIDGASGASNIMALPFSADTKVTAAAAQTITASRLSTISAAGCTSTAAQAFDPDTKMIAWEHYNFDTGAYNFAGGFFRSSDMTLATAATALGKLGLMPFGDSATQAAALGDLCAGLQAFGDQETVSWTQCAGMIEVNAAGATRAAQTLTRLLGYIYAWDEFSRQTDLSHWPMSSWCAGTTGAGLTSCVTNYQNYAKNTIRNSLIDDFTLLAKRIRKYASGSVTSSSLAANLVALAAGPTEFHDAFMIHFADYATVVSAAPSYQSSAWSTYGPYEGEVGHDGTSISLDGAQNSAGTDAKQISAGSLVTSFASQVGAGGWYYVAYLSDTKAPTAIGATSGGEPRYVYNLGAFDRYSSITYLGGDSGLKVLPIEDAATSPGGWAAQHRRVHRYGGSSNAWQDGYSPVQLWYTGGTVAMCNNAERLWATCFFRPRAVSVGGANLASFRADQPGFWTTFYTWLPDSAMHPQMSSAFYCGLPSANSLKTRDAVNPNNVFEAVKFTSLNTVATNIDLQLDGSAGAGTALGNEGSVFKELYSQMREEPYKLINHLILDKDDYRKLLTANYTYGNSCLKFFYDTQGFYLPSHNEAVGAICSGPGGADAQFGPGAAIPIGNITTVAGSHQGDTTNMTRMKMWTKLYGGEPANIPPRVYSGILSMPAFIAPVATTARGISSRYFTRLLCDMPNFYDPAKDPVDPSTKSALHTSFISERKHLQPECYQCHRNLDPLASALSWTFRGLLQYPSGPGGFADNSGGGEGGPDDYLGEIDVVAAKQKNISGIRHGGALPSNGAFMGQPVAGLADLGLKVSHSDKFASCVTQTVFQNLFGRAVQFSDVQYFKGMVKNFEDPNGANFQFTELIKSMIKSDMYQRKN